MSEKPGVMLYFEELHPALQRLDDRQLGMLLRAVIEYAEQGILSELDGMTGFAFDMMRPKLDRDDERYREQCLKSRYATYCREAKKKGFEAVSFEAWTSGDIGGYPTATAQSTTSATSSSPTVTGNVRNDLQRARELLEKMKEGSGDE